MTGPQTFSSWNRDPCYNIFCCCILLLLFTVYTMTPLAAFLMPLLTCMYQGIARKLVKSAVQEAAKKREMRYSDLKKVDRGVRRHFHDDITVIVVFFDSNAMTTAAWSRPSVSLRGGGFPIHSNTLAPFSVPTELNNSYWNHAVCEGARQEDKKKVKENGEGKTAVVISCSVFHRSCSFKTFFRFSSLNLVTSALIARYKIRLFLAFLSSFFFLVLTL